ILARPFTRPDSFTSTTLPRTFVPFSRTVFPSTITGSARLARKWSPGELFVVLTPSMSATRRRDPAGIAIFGSGLILSNRPSDFLPESALVSEGPLVQPAVLASHTVVNNR